MQRFIENKPIDARPITHIQRGWRWCKRKPAISSLAALLFLSMGIGTAVSSYFSVDANQKAASLSIAKDDADDQREIAQGKASEADQQRQLAEDNLSDANEQRRKVSAALGDLRSEKYTSDILLAESRLDSHELSRAISRLEGTRNEFRHWEWGYLAGRCMPAGLEFKARGGFALSHDSQILAVESSGSPGISIIDTSTMKVQKTLSSPGIKETVGSMCGFSNDDALLVTNGSGVPIRVWDVKKGTLKHEIPMTKWVASAAVSSTGPFIVASLARRFLVFNIETGEVVHEKQDLPYYHWSSVLLPSNDRVALGSAHMPVVVDLDTDAAQQVGDISGGPWSRPVLSQDGKQIAMIGRNHPHVFIYDVDTLTLQHTLEHPQPTSAFIDTAQGLVITGARDGTVRVWDGKSFQLKSSFVAHSGGVTRFDVSKDGRFLVTSGRDEVVRIWPASRLVARTPQVEAHNFVEMSPTGKLFAQIVSPPDELTIHRTDDPYGPSLRISLEQHIWPGLNNRQVMSWNSSGTRLAVTSIASAFICESSSGEILTTLDAEDNKLESIVFSSDGSVVICGSNGRVMLFDSLTGKNIGEMRGFHGKIIAMCVIPGTNTIAAVGYEDSEITLFDVPSRQSIGKLQAGIKQIVSLDCDEDGRRLVAGVQKPSQILLFDLQTGSILSQTRPSETLHDHTLQSVAISPDGRRMAALTRERNISFFDSDTGAYLLQMKANVIEFHDFDWSSDGKTIVTVALGVDSLKFWRALDWTKSLAQLRQEQFDSWDDGSSFKTPQGTTDADLKKLRELYSHSRDWENALAVEEAITKERNTWGRVALLHQTGRTDDYREARTKLLVNYDEITGSSAPYMFLRMTLLEPVNDELRPAILWMSEQNSKSEQQWKRAMVGKAMYRLGDFRQWYEELPIESPLRKGQSLTLAMVSFQEHSSPDNRKALVSEIDRVERDIQDQLNKGVIKKDWPGYVEKSAWLAEARRVLAGGE